MALIDKVNEELLKLQQELNNLDTFTKQIGKAGQASEAVVQAANTFVEEFGKSTRSVSKSLNAAVEEFSEQCTTNSESFKKSGKNFADNTEKSLAKLQEIKEEISEASAQLKALKSLFEQIQIEKKLKEIEKGLQDTAAGFDTSHQALNKKSDFIIDELNSIRKEASSRNLVLTILISATFVVGVIGIFF
jgi:ABC-type transporter Mla subunit MlaD